MNNNGESFHFCAYCGKKIPVGVRFCPYCGKPAVSGTQNNQSNSVSQQSHPMPQSAPQPKPYVEQQSQNNYQGQDQSSMPNPEIKGIRRVFSASTLCFWVKGNVSVTNNGIDINYPNTVFFDLFPAGNVHKHYTLKSVDAPGIDTAYSIKNFIIGAFVFIMGFPLMITVIFGLLCFILGAAIFMNGIITRFTLQNNGREIYFDVPCFDRQKMEDIVTDIQNRIEEVQNARDASRDLSNFFPRQK